ncbi:MAG: 2,4-dienoyl-CoA reductase-like NADH-dependent reductase (Old Yellow Enzyme family) [Planctomycetota bacterium]|jgi:2,4-dienoyl-CoA reductase-like NADH-dependent reductase (Old Yellow Enzyme family)
MTSALFTPIKLRELELSNRIVLSPMCQYAAKNGCAGDWHLMHLGQFMVSGVALVMTEMTNVQARGRITPHCLGLFDQNCEDALQRVVNYCRQLSDTPMGVQLAHSGRKASSSPPWQGRKRLSADQGGWQSVGPSPISHSDAIPAPNELTLADIDELIEDFVTATQRAERLGFDAIELHGAHGYLLHQFLSPLSNQRSDEYGGNLENRMRLPLQVFDAVRDIWPEHKPLGMRLSAIDWAAGGLTIEDTIKLSDELKRKGCDWIDVSSGGISYVENIVTGPGYQVPFSEQVRAQTGINTMAVGMITEAEQAENIIASGQADMVALARGLLFNPRWPWHAAIKLGVELEYPSRYQRCAPANMNPF